MGGWKGKFRVVSVRVVEVKWRDCQDEGKGEIMVSIYIYT
jgi:hypothetical protein